MREGRTAGLSDLVDPDVLAAALDSAVEVGLFREETDAASDVKAGPATTGGAVRKDVFGTKPEEATAQGPASLLISFMPAGARLS